MTTVAFRDGVMASDSQGNDSGIGIVKLQKLFKRKIGGKEYLIGVCGYWEAALLWMDWFAKKDSATFERLTKLTEDNGFTVLLWDGKKLMYSDTLMRLTECNQEYYAVGSGAAHAITAMDCGKSARQAVQMAMKRDINTGGRVVTMRLP